ncbi:hypothetical protein BAE44_0014153 [Dichanthelium oligosanthes]|uniref:RNase H type-1 domain-containing protein n=1 Tax=Dichanthelium oligosanthes TaxID=888268 RepID=A0A1E5VI74_9POAL|nr:hypothetical protein BAE44_0014153 [Dichanthelium oligosanthes]
MAGTFFRASAVVSKGATDLETLEAMACKEGLALANNMLMRQFRLASDCANVAKGTKGEAMGPYGHIIQETKAGMADFQHTEFVHQRRESNIDAQNLAMSSLYNDIG